MERAPNSTRSHIGRALQESCRDVRDDARKKEFHRFRSKSGALEKAIRFRVNLANCEGIIDIDPAVAPYGIFVHEPTGTHAPPDKRLPSKFYRWADGSYAIRPVNKKFLRFIGSNGKHVFARQVRHPGTPADQFLYKSAEYNRSNINQIFARHTDAALREAGLL